jgi:UDP-N-acetylglucosamine:LPS N-acetylglucosamine transferase
MKIADATNQPPTPSRGGRDSRSILFATIAAGGSHVSTAEAMRQACELAWPGEFQTKVREPMVEFGFDRLDRRHKAGWRRALRRPWTIVWGQRLIDALPAATAAFHRRLLRDFAERAAAELSSAAPDLVVVNHGWLTMALTLAQRRFGLKVPVLTFETSTLNANALWAEPNAERFVVASLVSKRRLVRFGIPADRIDVIGYPVRQEFLCAPEKREARRRLALEDAFTCLVTLGGEGVGGTPEAVLHELAAEPELQVVVVAGRNRELLDRLAPFHERLPRLRLLGFVDHLADYLAAADVVIGKTGPATVFETLAVGRPLLAPARFGTAENKMCRLLENHGLGGAVDGPGELMREIRCYRDDPARLAVVERTAARLDFPGMSARFGRYLGHYARTRQPAEDACGVGLPLEPGGR